MQHLHLIIGRSDNSIKQRWRLINRAVARKSARGAKSSPRGAAALADQSIPNDDLLKVTRAFLFISQWQGFTHSPFGLMVM